MDTQEEQVQEEVQEEESLQDSEEVSEEVPEKEYIMVDGEQIEIDPEEVIGTKPDGTPIKLKDTDNPKSYKFFQARDTKNNQKIKELSEKLEKLGKTEKRPSEEAPKRPSPLPPKPKGFNMTDAVTDPDSPSAKWYNEKVEHDIELDQYLSYKEELEARKEKERQQQEQMAQFRDGKINELQAAGATLEESMKIFDWLTSKEAANPQNLIRYHRTVNAPPKRNPKPVSSAPSSAAASSSSEERIDPEEYTKHTDFNWMYKKKE